MSIRQLLWKYLFTGVTDYCVVCQKRKTHHSAKDCILVKLYEWLCKVLNISCANCEYRNLITLKDQISCHGCYSYRFWEEVKMKKVYISQPMKDKTREEIIETRNKAIEYVKSKLGEDITILDSYFGVLPPKNPLWLLGKCLEVMADADIIYFVDGWQDYRGCRIEHQCAEEYGIEILN